MRIAICDDEKRICAILAEKVGEICPDAEIMTYTSGEELVDAKFDGRNINERISWSRQMWAVFDESTNIVPK